MAIARRGSTEQRRVFDPIGSEKPSRKSTKRRSTSAHGWPPVCSRRCRRYLPAPPALPLPLPPPMRDARRRIVSGGPDGRARLSPCRPVRYANRDVTRRIVIHDFAAHTLAHARASIEARIESGQFDRRGVQPQRRATRIQRVLRRRFRFAPGHDGRRDAGTQRLTSARAVKRIARVDPYRKVGTKPRRIDVERPACATARQRFIRRPPASRSRGARARRKDNGNGRSARTSGERRAARCGGDPSRREMHGMRMGRL
ncbi:hypothetical protein [Burkholderia pseudomallei]|uniref:hypothetical protein n=2 Tax=Burkholderia pseudomallei TaxID=28450 RepID=UPI001379F9C9|nr:hypothetical protein [Burkholderia pseudomallei]